MCLLGHSKAFVGLALLSNTWGTSSVRQGRSADTMWLQTLPGCIVMQEAKSAHCHARISYSNDRTSAMVAGRLACKSTAGVDITSCCALLVPYVHVMDPHTPAHTTRHQPCSPRRCGSPVSPANSALPSPPLSVLKVDSGDEKVWGSSAGVQPRY